MLFRVWFGLEKNTSDSNRIQFSIESRIIIAETIDS